MIREYKDDDRQAIDRLQYKLQEYFSEIDETKESKTYENFEKAHLYLEQMIKDVKNMNGKIYVAEKDGKIVGFVQGVIIEHKFGEDPIFDLSHEPRKEGWIGLLFVEPAYRCSGFGKDLMDKIEEYFVSQNCDCVRLLVLNNNNAVDFYKGREFISHNLEMVKKLDSK